MEQPEIIINVGIQFDGYVFRLRPRSREWLKTKFSLAHTVASVFIGFDKKQDFQQIHRSIWNQISILLTGLSLEEINQLGGFTVFSPRTGEEVFHSLGTNV
ncbi:hypothetical protein HYR99_05485 [Candidatus Poribacteria bacterium]|nr:hypothetical protein [Candidatus Poribacteria bacterium]